MASKTSIEWSDSTWTPLRSRRRDNGKIGVHCEKISPGCAHCYSERFNLRGLPNQGTRLPFARASRKAVEHFLDERILAEPLRWRKPRKVFVCSQTDLFGEWVTDEQIDRVFAVMALAPQHTFQVLTKRAERMREHCSSPWMQRRVDEEKCELMGAMSDQGRMVDAYVGEEDSCYFEHGYLPNVWLGVSVEDQAHLPRLYDLKRTDAAVRWVSFEPLLEGLGDVDLSGVDWAVYGGESGPRARPCDLEWIRRGIECCRKSLTAPFVKQLGARVVNSSDELGPWPVLPAESMQIGGSKGGDINEFPMDLKVREFPEVGR